VGPTLVDRSRRKQNDGTSMLHKAMKLKKRKNLDSRRGNSFSALQADNLFKLADDIKLKIGCDRDDSNVIIDNLISEEKNAYDQFVGDHPEVILPTNLDVSCSCPELINNEDGELKVSTLIESLKEENPSPSLTEVVRRGKRGNGKRK
jgi:hypothetical protein